MSDRAFIPVLIAWMLAVLLLSVPFPSLFAAFVARVRTARNARASALEIKRQVKAAEVALGKSSSLPTQG